MEFFRKKRFTWFLGRKWIGEFYLNMTSIAKKKEITVPNNFTKKFPFSTSCWISRKKFPNCNSWCQFHQHFMHTFFVQKFFTKLFYTYILGLNFFWRKNIGTNALKKCWWNLPLVYEFVYKFEIILIWLKVHQNCQCFNRIGKKQI